MRQSLVCETVQSPIPRTHTKQHKYLSIVQLTDMSSHKELEMRHTYTNLEAGEYDVSGYIYHGLLRCMGFVSKLSSLCYLMHWHRANKILNVVHRSEEPLHQQEMHVSCF